MFCHLFLLSLLGFSQAQFDPSETRRPVTPGKHEFKNILPRICVECCMDIMFILDRSSAAEGPSNDQLIHWNRMRQMVADLAADPLNRSRIRTAAMQMGNPTEISREDLIKADAAGTDAAGNTGIRYPLGSGPFPASITKWNYVDRIKFSPNHQAAWATAAKVAMKHLTTAPDPWVVNTAITKRCDPTNHVRVIIWIVAGGPPANNDPCPLLPKLVEAEIQQHIVGAGEFFTEAVRTKLTCMFSKGAVTTNSLYRVPEWSKLTGSQFAIDPCTKCNDYLDVVFVLDESASLCDTDSCEKATEFDRELEFVGQIVAELAKKDWKKNRVSIWTFADRKQTHLKLGESESMTEPEVQTRLNTVRKKFAHGQTATALAYNEGLGELEFAPPRADGKKPKKVMIFLTDGGPNPGYYAVDDKGERTTSGCSKKSPSGYCLADYAWSDRPAFWNGSTDKGGDGQMNMAVCTDSKDPDPKWVRYEATSNGHKRFVEKTKTYADAVNTLDMTLVMLMVGKRWEQHKKDVECLTSKSDKGGILTAKSFSDALKFPAFKAALINSVCTDAKLDPRKGLFARWTAYQALQEQQLMAKVQEVSMKQQIAPANYIWSGALVIGISVAFLYGKQSRAEYYTPLLSDELMDVDGV